MTELETAQTQTTLLDQVISDLEAGRQEELTTTLLGTHPAEVANLLESLPPEQRSELWDVVPVSQESEVLSFLHDEARTTIVDEMDQGELVAAAESMAPEDLAEFIDELPEDLTNALLISMDADHRKRLDSVLTFEEASAGRLMSTDVISVRKDVSIAVVLRWLRRHESLPPHTDSLMVIDDEGLYLGKLDVAHVLTSHPDTEVEAIMQPEAATVRDNLSEHDVAALFERRDLISVAVLDSVGKLLGRITIDDIVDVIREESDRALLRSAGLNDEEDMFAPVLPSARRRGVWLGINLITVFVAAWVIGRFEQALDQIVALAILLPIVASMGGIAGSQTLTLTIRALALNQIANANVRWLMTKEVLVGAVNGMVWALVVALVTY
ncbi:MAG: magnesium transporter, partial [Sedimenticola sp.]|nr:magnesium transporter [Sedimenticola sp.]